MIKERYINLFTDFGFKRVFGQEANKDLLMDFLNQILPQEYQILDLSFSKTEHTGFAAEDRKAIFDLHCISTNKERFIVELQKAKQQFFKDRSLYYTTFPITEQAEIGDWNYKLEPVFLIAILNFSFDDSAPTQIRHHVMLKDENCKVFYEKLHFIYLEVVKFNKTLQECNSRFEKWLWIFKNLPNLEEIPADLVDNMLLKVFKIAQVSQLNRAEQEAYIQSLKYLRDLHNVVDTAFTEGEQIGLEIGLEKGEQIGLKKGEQIGLEKGEQIGLEKGKTMEKQKMACKLLQLGTLSIKQIAEITGLSLELIDTLDCSKLDANR